MGVMEGGVDVVEVGGVCCSGELLCHLGRLL